MLPEGAGEGGSVRVLQACEKQPVWEAVLED